MGPLFDKAGISPSELLGSQKLKDATSKEGATRIGTASWPSEKVAQQFRDDGFVVLKKSIPTHLLSGWKSFANEYFRQCFEILHNNGHIDSTCSMGQGAKHGFREIVMRSPGRFELSLLNLDKDRYNASMHNSLEIPSAITIIEPLAPLISNLFSDTTITLKDLKLCHISLLVATPGSVEQTWHADGGHVSLTEHLPCHCLNIFIPLQDVHHEMGPTEFRPGGHFLTRNLAPMMLAAKCRKSLRAPVWPELQLGDAIIFDYRILHRGRANNATTDRNLLVLTFCEPWFEDVLNFPKRSMLDSASAEA